MQNATPKDGAVLLRGERVLPNKNHPDQQTFYDADRLRALHLIHRFSVHPDMAMTLAALAFAGGRA